MMTSTKLLVNKSVLAWFIHGLLIYFALFEHAGFAGEQLSEHAIPLTVMTFNIRVGAGVRDWGKSPFKLKDESRPDLAPVAAAIRSVAPDIVGLQEVSGENQSRELARLLGMQYAYVPHGKGKNGGWWGVALLSRYVIEEVQRHEVSQGWGNIKSILLATLRVADHIVTVVVMHKDRDLKDGASLRHLTDIIETKNHMPIVVVGDLNIKPDDERHRILAPWLFDTAILANTDNAQFARTRGTVIGPKMNLHGLRIDYVLVNNRFDVLDAGLVPKAHWRASDHLAYYAKLRFKNNQTE